MNKEVANLTDDVAGILTGVNLNNVTNLYGVYSRAANVLAQHIDVPEGSGKKNYMLFDGVYDYPAPSSIFGGSFSDLRPQGISRTPWDTVTKVPVALFDQTKAYARGLGMEVSSEWNLGVPVMRVAGSRAQQRLVLDDMADASSWTPTTIPALFSDYATFYQSPASIRFNLPTTGSIEKTLQSPINISSYIGVGSAFVAIREQSTDLTSMTLRLGSDNANYYEVTQTTGFLGALQADDFYLMQFDLANAITVGTPNDEAINYVQISMIANGAMINVRLGNLFLSMPTAYQMLYYTSAIFNVAGAQSNTVTGDTDIITLSYAAYTIYQYITAQEILIQMGGGASANLKKIVYDVLFNKDTGLVPMYRADNPSEELRMIGNYYESQGM